MQSTTLNCASQSQSSGSKLRRFQRPTSKDLAVKKPHCPAEEALIGQTGRTEAATTGLYPTSVEPVRGPMSSKAVCFNPIGRGLSTAS